jgi:hypothetical protein
MAPPNWLAATTADSRDPGRRRVCNASGVIRATLLRSLTAAVLPVVLTGCFKIDMDLDISENETVDGEIILAVSDELAEATGQSRAELVEQFEADVMRDAPDGVTQQPYSSEGLAGTRLILDNVAVDEFSPADETLSIVHEGDQYVVDGGFDPAAVGDLGALSEEAVANTMDVRVAITFPGDVIEHNGELDGRTVTWVPTSTEAIDIHARAEDSAGRASALPLVVAAVVIVGAAASLVLRRRRDSEPSEEPTASEAVEPPTD